MDEIEGKQPPKKRVRKQSGQLTLEELKASLKKEDIFGFRTILYTTVPISKLHRNITRFKKELDNLSTEEVKKKKKKKDEKSNFRSA